jgi:hypothetical protein
MALGFVVASDIVNAVLIHYVRGKTLSQSTQDKPLLRELKSKQKAFAAGNLQISEPLQFTYMSDTPGFFVGWSEDDAINFAQAQNILRAVYPWRAVSAGIGFTWMEMMKDGVTISNNNKISVHSQREAEILTELMENRMADFDESWMRAMNLMLWADGSQDAKAVPGLTSLITDTPTVGTTGGVSRTQYPLWQNFANLNIGVSAANQTLTRTLRNQVRLLKQFGGKPNKIFCGSKFIEALEVEVTEKGLYTQQGFAKGENDAGVDKIKMLGLGTFEWDPTLDNRGQANRCYVYDDRRIKLMPMQGEENKVLTPERPYNYMVFFRNITWVGGMTVTQNNCNAIFACNF